MVRHDRILAIAKGGWLWPLPTRADIRHSFIASPALVPGLGAPQVQQRKSFLPPAPRPQNPGHLFTRQYALSAKGFNRRSKAQYCTMASY